MSASRPTSTAAPNADDLPILSCDLEHMLGDWKTTTFVAGLRSTALTAPGVVDGPMNGLAYVEQIPAPSHAPGDIVMIAQSQRSQGTGYPQRDRSRRRKAATPTRNRSAVIEAFRRIEQPTSS
jgi:hypothetical protein